MFRKLPLLFMMLAIVCAWLALAVDKPKSGKTRKQEATRVFAPYVDVARLPNSLAQIHADSGVRFFTLAFVNADQGCVPSWPGSHSISTDVSIFEDVKNLRQQGGDVIIAFGGYEGTELAQACADVPSLQAAYQKVVDRYNARVLDFDVEHLAIEDPPSIDRRNAALKKLAQENSGLQINFTLPATPTGLTAQAVAVLKSAVAQGTPIKVVNVMTMDYGATATSKQMGSNAISAIEGAQNQLKELGLDARLGITPMLGVNDTPAETFTLTDAASVLSYAQKNQSVALLAFWSVGRDNGSCAAVVSPTCSGIPQRAWEFSHLFAAFH